MEIEPIQQNMTIVDATSSSSSENTPIITREANVAMVMIDVFSDEDDDVASTIVMFGTSSTATQTVLRPLQLMQ
eukprot:143558-Prorocentrum_minimum.AAC.1